jgi:preprotein translocase subunit SecD
VRATNNQSRRVAAHDRQLRALELRKAGATYQVIAEQLGYAQAKGAYKAVASALKLTLREPAEELRELEVARLDAMLLVLWRRVQAGDEKAVDRVLRIMERRARLLGLDAPTNTKVELTLEDIDREIERLEAELRAKERTQ